MSGVLLRVSFFDLENWKARDPTPEWPKAIANNEGNSVDLITEYDVRADSNSPGTEIRTKPKILGGGGKGEPGFKHPFSGPGRMAAHRFIFLLMHTVHNGLARFLE